MSVGVNTCPNCGAPIKHYYNYCCEYCGTFLKNTDEEIKKLNNVDITIKNVEISRNPINYNFIITLTGVAYPKVQWYEEGVADVIISGDTFGKRIGYRIQFPMELYYKYMGNGDFIELLDYISKSLPEVFEPNKQFIFSRVLEQLDNIGRRRLSI